MQNEEKLDSDLSVIMKDFVNFRERYNEDHNALQDSKGVIRTLNETVRLCRDAEKHERQKANQALLVITQQQALIDNMQQLMEENNRLKEQNTSLVANNKHLLSKMASEVAALENTIEILKVMKDEEIEDIKKQADQSVREAQEEMEGYRAEFNMKQGEMEDTFNALQAQKYEELNVTALVYEEKLQTIEEKMTEYTLKLDESAVIVAALKQRNADLEKKLAEADKYRQQLLQAPPTYRFQNVNNKGAKTGTANQGTEYPKPAWRNQALDEPPKRTLQPIPFQTTLSDSKKVSFATAAPKKRRLFTLQDDNI